MDIFSALDYSYSNFQFLNFIKFVWFFVISMFLIKLIKFYSCQGYGFFVNMFYNKGWIKQLNSKSYLILIIFFFFFFLCFENLLGLVPYTFRLTRHIVVKFFLAFECWLVIIFFGCYQHVIRFVRHFTPLGRPIGLSFSLNYIEWVRVFIRPLTLSLRLAVKIRTGHVFIRLLRTGVLIGSFNIGLIVLLFSFFCYIFFEIFVRFIQGFVFSLLLVQYADEV